MASRKSLNVENLEALGAARLAELLFDISTDDAAIKRRLRLALAGGVGSAEAAREIAKRLTSIARARGFLDWQRVKLLAADLDGQRRAILDLVAPTDPSEAFDLLWRLVNCAEAVFARSDDSSGRLSAVFHSATRDLGPLAQAANLDTANLVSRAFQALCGNNYGEWDGLIAVLAPQLGTTGLRELRKHVEAWQAEPVATPPELQRRVIGWSSSGKIYEDEIQVSHRRHTSASALQQISDELGDIEGYIAQFDPKSRAMPTIAAGIARRLLDAGRPNEAWEALEMVEPSRRDWNSGDWDQASVDTLEALGKSEDAQAFRWQRFIATLSTTHLRAYLRKLPDFEDFDAEQRALVHALAFSNVHQALAFLIDWPDLQRANELVLGRVRELNGEFYELMSPAAEALESKHPLAATLLRRAMIDFTLSKARASRYKHAARHLHECAGLAQRVTDFAGYPSHSTYEKDIRVAHGRKAAFWQEVEAFR
jgi:hypothetical protein